MPESFLRCWRAWRTGLRASTLLVAGLIAGFVAAPQVVADTDGERLQVEVLDVGEGQATLLQRGPHGVLIDTGHMGRVRGVLDHLRARGVRELDYLVLTHLHPDHATGYFRMREAFPRTPVLHNGHDIPADYTPDSVRWVHDALRVDDRARVVGAGDVIDWRGVELRFLWPRTIEGMDLNRNSLALSATFGDLAALVMGDAQSDAERSLLAAEQVPERVALLVAGHHGSSATGDAEFVAAVAPAVSAISVNADNFRGYPDADVVRRLREHSKHFHRTDEDGTLCVTWRRSDDAPSICPPPDP